MSLVANSPGGIAIADQFIRQKFGVLPALDVDSYEEMLSLVQDTCTVPHVAGYKLGLTGVLPHGLKRAISDIRRLTDLPIIYDHQKAGPDMPDMGEKFAAISGQAGANGLVLFPVAGPTAVRSFTESAIKHSLLPLVGGHIPVPDYCVSGGGFMRDDVLTHIIKIAAQSGTRCFILPANLPDLITSLCEWISQHVKDPVVFLTGIGALGGSIETAFRAASAVPTRFAIVGRAISNAPNRGQAAAAMCQQIQNAC